MKLTLLTISLLLSLTSLAEDSQGQTSQPATPAAAPPANGLTPQAEEPIPCPLPGEEPANCPAPRAGTTVTEGGIRQEAGGVIRPEAKPILVSNPGENAYLLGINQPLTPLRTPPNPPLKDEK